MGGESTKLSTPQKRADFCCTSANDRLVGWDARTPDAEALTAALTLAEELVPRKTFLETVQNSEQGAVRDWNAAERRYFDWDSIRRAMTSGDIALVRGDYIERVWQDGGILPRRQELPRAAVWDVEELLLDVGDARRPMPRLIALSYSWVTPQHPDPEGFHLRIFAPLLSPFAKYLDTTVSSFAVFIDWCALPQRPRSKMEESAYSQALHYIDIWYAHNLTYVWILPLLPGGHTSSPPYAVRGWTTFERALAGLVKPAEMVLDIDTVSRYPPHFFTGLDIKRYRVPRGPPEVPEAFTARLCNNAFANQDDQEFISDKYAETFHRVVASVESFNFANLGWSDSEVIALSRVLPLCGRLRELDLRDNVIGARGTECLAAAFPRCDALALLAVGGNFIDHEALQVLEHAWLAADKSRSGLSHGKQHNGKSQETETMQQSAWCVNPLLRISPSAHRASSAIAGMQLHALLDRQAAFETRVDTAMRKLTDNLGDLDSMRDSASGAGSINDLRLAMSDMRLSMSDMRVSMADFRYSMSDLKQTHSQKRQSSSHSMYVDEDSENHLKSRTTAADMPDRGNLPSEPHRQGEELDVSRLTSGRNMISNFAVPVSSRSMSAGTGTTHTEHYWQQADDGRANVDSGPLFAAAAQGFQTGPNSPQHATGSPLPVLPTEVAAETVESPREVILPDSLSPVRQSFEHATNDNSLAPDASRSDHAQRGYRKQVHIAVPYANLPEKI